MTTAYPGYDGYPPAAGGLNPMFDYEAQNHRGSTTTVPDAAHKEGDALNRGLMRTPSPTPSEKAELARSGVLDWRAMKRWQFWIRREWLCEWRFGHMVCERLTVAHWFPRVLCHNCHNMCDFCPHDAIPQTNCKLVETSG
jgi:hypothetical protein